MSCCLDVSGQRSVKKSRRQDERFEVSAVCALRRVRLLRASCATKRTALVVSSLRPAQRTALYLVSLAKRTARDSHLLWSSAHLTVQRRGRVQTRRSSDVRSTTAASGGRVESTPTLCARHAHCARTRVDLCPTAQFAWFGSSCETLGSSSWALLEACCERTGGQPCALRCNLMSRCTPTVVCTRAPVRRQWQRISPSSLCICALVFHSPYFRQQGHLASIEIRPLKRVSGASTLRRSCTAVFIIQT